MRTAGTLTRSSRHPRRGRGSRYVYDSVLFLFGAESGGLGMGLNELLMVLQAYFVQLLQNANPSF
jgi:hypothetical protein